jgi:hypothetical protein
MCEVNTDGMEALLLKTEVARLVNARPHVFPPSINPPYEYRDGVAVAKRSDTTKMTQEVWEANNCDVVHWSAIVVESTPNGERQLRKSGKPTTISMAYGGKGIWEHCFANCMLCWRLKKRDFFDSERTANPYKVDIGNPTILQLGCCGCVICNECIMAQFETRPSEAIIHCPYCKQAESFNRDVKAWMLIEEVLGKWEDIC